MARTLPLSIALCLMASPVLAEEVLGIGGRLKQAIAVIAAIRRTGVTEYSARIARITPP